ncbi:MAG: recombinase family protein [Bacteroidota bacterium]
MNILQGLFCCNSFFNSFLHFAFQKTSRQNQIVSNIRYAKTHHIKLVLVSEISRIGRRVVDILSTVDTIHNRGIGLFVRQFNMISSENGTENPMVMLLLQVMSIGAEMENNHRKIQQAQGIALAKLQQKCNGRKAGSRGNREKLLKKYEDVADLLKKSDLSLRRIARITGRSVNTVTKVRELLAA